MQEDPSLLLKAIDGMVVRPLESNSGIHFRKVDLRPTATSVDSVFKGLFTEFEQIDYLHEGEVTSPTSITGRT